MAGREEIGINDLDDPTLGDLIKGGLLQQSDRAQPQQQQWPQQQQPITPPPAPDTNPDTNPESGFLAAVAINRVFSADQMRITSPHVWQVDPPSLSLSLCLSVPLPPCPLFPPPPPPSACQSHGWVLARACRVGMGGAPLNDPWVHYLTYPVLHCATLCYAVRCPCFLCASHGLCR